jgi:hypothetical protein
MTALTATVAKHATLPAITATVTTTVAGAASPATDEVQTITLDGGAVATGGTFTITYSGQTTSALAYDANGATISAALDALSNLGDGDCVATGTLNDGITLTFSGAGVAATNVAAVTVSVASTTGTSADAVTVTPSATVGDRPGNQVVVVNRHSTNPLYFKVGATDPGEFGLAADDSYVVLGATKSDPIPVDNLESFVVRVVAVPATTYSVHLIPG